MFIKELKKKTTKAYIKYGNIINRTTTRIHSLHKCDICGEFFERKVTFKANKPKMLSISDAKKRNTYCKSCYLPKISQANAVKSKMSKISIGDKKIDREGYVHIFVDKEWKYHKTWSTHGIGWVREHVYIISESLKRMLFRGEQIHHIDGVKANNNIDNLVLLSASEHKRAHNSYEIIGKQLFDMGYISYDKNINQYILSDKIIG